MSDEHIRVLAEVIGNVWDTTTSDEGLRILRIIAEEIATEFAYFDGNFDADEFLSSCNIGE